MNRREFHAALLTLLGSTAVPAWAADAIEAYTDPAKAGPDFLTQGEYLGEVDGKKLGCQVIALGNSAFQAVLLPGGLPGEGWDGKTRIKLDGKADATSTFFPGLAWNARVQDGKLTGKSDKGSEFALRKVSRRSPTEGLKAPEGARVLFDGSGVDAWNNGKMTEDGLLVCGTQTRDNFTDFALHVEFRTPFKPLARGQSRGNSGVYILGRYELQILDSFGLTGENNECGGLYTRRAPDVNMCFPPLSWQTYDIDFQAARFDAAGQKTKNALITVRHNGVAVHNGVEIEGPTGGARKRPELGTPAPITFQNHGNPVHLRNIWIVPKSA